MVHLGWQKRIWLWELWSRADGEPACAGVAARRWRGKLDGQALLDLLDRRYERALQSVDAAISSEPGMAYAHALRAHLLRAQGQDYDANLARSRASRLAQAVHLRIASRS